MNRNNELISLKSNQDNSIEELLQTQNVVSPAVDIFETNEQYFLVANMPGIKREDLQVKVENNNLIIFGKINYHSFLNVKYILQEIEFGNFHRIFKISDTIEKIKITARFDNGQLTVILPKQEKEKTRTIVID